MILSIWFDPKNRAISHQIKLLFFLLSDWDSTQMNGKSQIFNDLFANFSN